MAVRTTPVRTLPGRHLLAWVVALLCTVVPALAAGAQPAVLLPGIHALALGNAAELLEDPGRDVRIEQVLAGEVESRFRPLGAVRKHFGYPSSAFWLRVRVRSELDAPSTWLLRDLVLPDRALLYQVDGGRVTERRTGRMLPFEQRDVRCRDLAFRVQLEARTTTTLVLRYDTRDTLRIGPRLTTPEAFAEQLSHRQLGHGIYYGILGAMILYNLFVFVAVRDRTYLWYVLFQASFAAAQLALDEIAFELLWPSWPAWAHRSATVFAAVSFFCGIGFARSFAEIDRFAPAVARALRALGLVAIGIAAVAVLWAGSALNLASLALLAAVAALVAIGAVRAWREGSDNAPVFLLAWAPFLLASLVTTPAWAGLIVSDFANEYPLKIGSAAEATLLSLGLARRISLLRRDKQLAQSRLLRAEREHAATLEERVRTRTSELTEALTGLRQAQARLVAQARLATLGHVAAGVAHEVGNPLNFTAGGAAVLERSVERLRRVLDEAPDAVRDQADKALRDASKATALVQNGNERIRAIVEHLRAYVHGGEVALRDVDLATSVRATLALLGSRVERQGIEVDLQVAEGLPAIQARGGEINQVLTNLLTNSLDAMPSGGLLRITARLDRDHVELVVEDIGPGIPEELAQSVFEPFFTTRADGIGLGLSISQQIVLRHGGEISIEPGPGARVTVRLPIEQPEGPRGQSVGT
jgi:signal transduction histidine kinase